MTEKKVYRFGTIARVKPALNKMKEKSRGFRLSGHILCPGNGARSAALKSCRWPLRSLLSVALSSRRATSFYHSGLLLPLDGFSKLKWSVFRD
jgi:anti-sigma factor RsiW